MIRVYYRQIDAHTTVEEIQKITRELLSGIVERENVSLEDKIPLKVHFGEKGNHTYIKSENYQGIIEYLNSRNIDACYIETSVLYGGQRHCKALLLKTAAEHGFTQLPLVVADGERGEAFTEVDINRKNFITCKIGSGFLEYRQVIVLSHFKGHTLAGFGGAIKQLSMGHASKGGKLAMHMGIKPRIVNRKCKKCKLCMQACNENAITIDEKRSFIDHKKCVGCGACLSACTFKAVTRMTLKGIYNALHLRRFRERLVEYAYAAQLGKHNIYFNFAMNITKGCDCEPKKMNTIMDDIGIFVSMDPVAVDQACYDFVKERGKTFRGKEQLLYAEKVGLGSRQYELVRM
ncbi:MAG: DUF362 domain-containing protein [Spirochaetes bacterium]|nr:DUF362 domain-containing protein [Spirochaetota bacterium]